MNSEEILSQLIYMVEDPELEEFNPAQLSGMLLDVLEKNFDGLSERSISTLFLVAASLMRDHCNSVEIDIQAAREIFRRP